MFIVVSLFKLVVVVDILVPGTLSCVALKCGFIWSDLGGLCPNSLSLFGFSGTDPTAWKIGQVVG